MSSVEEYVQTTGKFRLSSSGENTKVVSCSLHSVSRGCKFVRQRQAALSPDALARVEEDMADLNDRAHLRLRGLRIRALERGQYHARVGGGVPVA